MSSFSPQRRHLGQPYWAALFFVRHFMGHVRGTACRVPPSSIAMKKYSQAGIVFRLSDSGLRNWRDGRSGTPPAETLRLSVHSSGAVMDSGDVRVASGARKAQRSARFVDVLSIRRLGDHGVRVRPPWSGTWQTLHRDDLRSAPRIERSCPLCKTRSRPGDRRPRIAFPADRDPVSRQRKTERSCRFGIHPPTR
jgi:hypothetical protein